MIYLCLPGIPPSANNAYLTVNHMRVLTKGGRKYKNELKSYVARHYPEELKIFVKDEPYVILVEFVFKGRDSLMSKTWPDKAADKYKKVDVTNRVKLFEDVLAEATGIDDRHNFTVCATKRWDRDHEMTNVWVWRGYEDPLHELLQNLRSAQSYGALPAL